MHFAFHRVTFRRWGPWDAPQEWYQNTLLLITSRPPRSYYRRYKRDIKWISSTMDGCCWGKALTQMGQDHLYKRVPDMYVSSLSRSWEGVRQVPQWACWVSIVKSHIPQYCFPVLRVMNSLCYLWPSAAFDMLLMVMWKAVWKGPPVKEAWNEVLNHLLFPLLVIIWRGFHFVLC